MSNRSDLGVEFWFYIGRDQIDAVLCGKDDMCE
jgi:hypothetical protein